MIQTEQKKNLTDLYFTIRDNPGWLADCHQVGYAQEHLDYLESLADEFDHSQPEKEATLVFKKEFSPPPRRDWHCTAIPEWKLNKARQYPLEKLVTLNSQNKTHCPFGIHKGDTLWVKNGFGFCFPCGARCDAIGWLMKAEGYTFVQAVEALIWRVEGRPEF